MSHAFITGGATGIGRAIAQALAESGYRVTLASRTEAALKRAVKGLNNAQHVVCDVRDKFSVSKAVRDAAESYGPVDVLINNAGLGVESAIADCTEEEWDLVLDTNLKGAFLTTQAVLPSMIERKQGYIIMIASQAAKHGYANAGPYCASKFGLLGFAEALQKEVRANGILVNSLCPALVDVKPAPGAAMRDDILHPSDLAAAVVFLLKQPRRIKFENLGLYSSSWSPDG